MLITKSKTIAPNRLPIKCNRGFTMLELVVVVVIVGVLFMMALNRVMSLQVDAERVTMEMQAGVLRSALGLQTAKYLAQNRQEKLAELVFVNPMVHLVEEPRNYLGDFAETDPGSIEGGNWYFDQTNNHLVYRVKNGLYFRSSLEGPARIRFRVLPVFDDADDISDGDKIVGIRLGALEPYAWLSDPRSRDN